MRNKFELRGPGRSPGEVGPAGCITEEMQDGPDPLHIPGVEWTHKDRTHKWGLAVRARSCSLFLSILCAEFQELPSFSLAHIKLARMAERQLSVPSSLSSKKLPCIPGVRAPGLTQPEHWETCWSGSGPLSLLSSRVARGMALRSERPRGSSAKLPTPPTLALQTLPTPDPSPY